MRTAPAGGLVRTTRRLGLISALPRGSSFVCRQCRAIQITSTPTSDTPRLGQDVFGTPGDSQKNVADARFEVLGTPYSLLSVTLSASQRLFTRRGTLVAVSGKPENAQSTLSILSPLKRAALGVPFLYQRITSTTPITALIGTKSPTTTFQVLQLDGTTDWMIAQRNALLAWTGHTLAVTPRIQRSLSIAHWGSSELTGRGLVALTAPGHIYELTLSEGEDFVAHPSHVVAYTIGRHVPQPFRFKSSSRINLQVPATVSTWFSDVQFIQQLRTSQAYQYLARALYNLRTVARRSIWGDRLFLQFQGPARILMSSRGVRVQDSLTSAEVNEIADAPPAGVKAADAAAASAVSVPKTAAVPQAPKSIADVTAATGGVASTTGAVKITVASVGQDGKVAIEEGKDLKQGATKP
ncbi:mitochondrial biogenesis AIM24-domain-containing protein [Microdochium trichocladiopsis]|uniref:Altered inheritance of mitochondria protein 24, mitochondrial n=1 Tax=Microdochium trichocladiopsis TaxID=1682393 RepID=A0A9P8Y485_9PEZI|nr:mitochondrial biogenesis AIM24-domain-containing protein [Microdochium trichocladiopsis]KAH7029282.1 mitochondrial biogenesis AIM24-domain-containing protein [Microdochium trichocladiopsis]